ncbi:hypothetical protein ACFXD5_36140 [Streptomyces sp. NPDC059385]|uniref:hypothetical protein n=1 Tax=Streptomyces sp. NPDC059385 TaxID=3346817 RepID=UPI00367F78D5
MFAASARQRTAVPNRALVVAAAVLWAVTGSAVGFILLVVAALSLLGAATGGDMAELMLWPVCIVGGAGAVFTLLYFAPGIRRLSREARFTLLGALACPAPLALVGYVMTR